MSNKYFKNLLLVCLISISSTLFAQKKVLDHTVYDSWKSIPTFNTTNDGQFAVASVKEQDGDDYLLIRNLKTSKKLIVPRGSDYKISPDQQYVIALIKAPFADTRQAKIKKTPDEKLPKDSLAIINLQKLSVVKIPNVKNFKIGKDYSDYIAYSIDDTIKVKDKKDIKAFDLILHNLASAKEDSIKNVSEYIFSRNGKTFSAILKPNPKDSINKTGVVYIDLDKYKKNTVSEGKTLYKNIALSEDGSDLAFLATTDSLKKEIKDYSLFYFNTDRDSANLIADKNNNGMPTNWVVSENYTPLFSKNGKRLLFGTAPIVLPKDTTIPDFEKAQLDIWNWQDLKIQPMQLVELEKKRKQTYLAYLDLDNTSKIFRIGTEEIPEITIGDENNGRYAIGKSDLKYQLEQQWNIAAKSTNDIWLFDLENKTNKLIKEKLIAETQLSPSGKYLAWYDLNDRQYHVYSLETDKEINLTKGLSINFWNEKFDMPMVPDPYGFAAWTEDDKALLVYDAYDIWRLDPTGEKVPENLTKNVGRDKKITFRYIKTDPDSRFIKADEKLLLSAFDNTSKENGFYELSNTGLKLLTMGKYTLPKVQKAKDKDVYTFVRSNYNTSPDLYVTNNMWKSESKLSDINPQMRDYAWGEFPELVSWITFDGRPTQGILYKPANFDPKKKYPVIVYFYEKHSDDLYQYYAPVPSRSVINIPFYTSRGYVVFAPDIQYGTGHPGNDAYNSVVSGSEMLIKNYSWIDKDNMAIQGQSWGGYQVAYLVTRTNMFKAAESGAPVSNMFSAYGGIRWQTGMSRQFQYEQTQSRIGATMWESPELYKENSPIFFANKVETPLLIMHNDKDGAVPWYQGIEYFMALRRLGKPVWLLQYNNEEHNLKERRNSKDLTIRIQQFFDYYLKGDPMPKWMKWGVPATDKGRDYGFELEK